MSQLMRPNLKVISSIPVFIPSRGKALSRLIPSNPRIQFKPILSTKSRNWLTNRSRPPLTDEILERALEDGTKHPRSSGKGKCPIVWFQNDLRLYDNEVLITANQQSTSILPLYIFDPRDYKKRACGFEKIGPFRAQFILESVKNLRENLEKLGSKLFVRIGKPEHIIPMIVKKIAASEVFCQEEASNDHLQTQNAVSKALGEIGIKLKKFWNSTLHHEKDLPFQLSSLPPTFGEFEKSLRNVAIRAAKEAPKELKQPPKTIFQEEKIPTLQDLGFSDSAISHYSSLCPSGPHQAVGGESKAMKEAQQLTNQSQSTAPFVLSHLASWTMAGCLSPKYLHALLSKRTKENQVGDDAKTELLWRDYYQYSFRKYALNKTRPLDSIPV